MENSSLPLIKPEGGVIGGDNVSIAKRTLKQRAYHGMREYLLISGYLFVVFGLFVLYKSVILAEDHIPFAAHGLALINALALGKVMLVAQEFHFADRFKEKPLIYTILFRSACFAIVLGCFKILEETAIGLYHGRSCYESIAAIGGGTLKGVLVLMAILTVVLIPFFGFAELRRVIGEGKLEQLLLTSRHRAGTSS